MFDPYLDLQYHAAILTNNISQLFSIKIMMFSLIEYDYMNVIWSCEIVH